MAVTIVTRCHTSPVGELSVMELNFHASATLINTLGFAFALGYFYDLL